MMLYTDEDFARFLSKIRVTDTCWEWEGTIDEMDEGGVGGYGRFYSKQDGKKKNLLAHREAYELFKGPVPEGLLVRHSCDNRICVNPEHLLVGTYQDNSNDAKARDRMRKREENGRAVLKEQDVHEIRDLCLCGLFTTRQIGAFYGITSGAVSGIQTGKNWSTLKWRI